MATFSYTAVKEGIRERGKIEATSKREAELLLRLKGYEKIKLSRERREIKLFESKKVTLKELLLFTRQLYTLIKSGLPLTSSLEALQVQEKNPYFREVIGGIRKEIEKGSTLAEAMGKYPNVFSSFYVNLIAAGEEGGFLELSLEKLYTQMEKIEAIRAKIKSALIYPTIIVVVAVGVVALLLGYVIPVFEKLFASFGSTLPTPTLIVIKLSHVVKKVFPFFVLFLAVGIVTLRKLYKKGIVKRPVDLAVLKIPIFGEVIKKAIISRSFYTLATLLESGIPLPRSLEISGNLSGNALFEELFKEAIGAVTKGRTLSSVFFSEPQIPYMASKMVEIGEQTGSLPEMLTKVAQYFDEEVETFVKNISSVIEPFLIIFLGVVIGGIVISMYLPIFKLAGAIR